MKLFVILAATLLLVASVDAKKKVKRSVTDPAGKQTFKFRNLKDANNLDQIPVIKTPTVYEQCKMKCKEERDSVAINEYIQQLKDELAAAELMEAQAAAAAEAAALAQASEAAVDAEVVNDPVAPVDPIHTQVVPEHKTLVREIVEAHDVIREAAAQVNKN